MSENWSNHCFDGSPHNVCSVDPVLEKTTARREESPLSSLRETSLSGLVLAKSNIRSECSALLVHIFCPYTFLYDRLAQESSLLNGAMIWNIWLTIALIQRDKIEKKHYGVQTIGKHEYPIICFGMQANIGSQLNYIEKIL